MKNLIILAVLLFLSACAPGAMTQITPEEGIIETIVEAPGHSKSAIYDSSRMWIAETFKSAKAVIEYKNKESGTIIGNGVISYPCQGIECMAAASWQVNFTLKLEAKDNRFRTTFSNIQMNRLPGGTINPVWSKAEMNNIKPALLNFNTEIMAYLGEKQKKSIW